MTKSMALMILFLGTCWGAVEVFGGEVLYRVDFPSASVPLSLSGLMALSIGRACFPRPGSSLAIGCVAAIYKLLAMTSAIAGTPVFLCHVLGICLLGAAFDVAVTAFPKLNKSIYGVAAAYAAYAMFALSITYVFAYEPWTAAGAGKIIRHVFVSGTLTAVGGALVVPLGFRSGRRIRQSLASPPSLRPALAAGCASLTTAVLWAAGLAVAIR